MKNIQDHQELDEEILCDKTGNIVQYLLHFIDLCVMHID